MKIDGRCHCGYVTFEAEADPETTTICNCTDCQNMSGAPLRAVIITRPSTFMLLSGEPTEYRKTADSGNIRVQAFCLGSKLFVRSIQSDLTERELIKHRSDARFHFVRCDESDKIRRAGQVVE
jgi:hypothetical protein